MDSDYCIEYSCPRRMWDRRSAIDDMLEDLLYGQTFRVTASRQQVVHLTEESFRPRVDLLAEKHGRVLFSVRVPRRQFPDGAISAVVTQLWGNVLDYPGIRLESIDPHLVVACAKRVLPARRNEVLRRGRGPLLGTVLKPTWGLSTAEKIDIACAFVEMGGDVIKEDETCFLTAEDIVREQSAIQSALYAVSSRSRGIGLYVPNITGIVHNMDAIKRLMEQGMSLAMVNFLVCGMSCVQRLIEATSPDLLIWGHRVGYACMANSMTVYALTQLATAIGLAVVHIGTPAVASEESMVETTRIVQMLTEAEAHGAQSPWPVFTKTTANIVPALISSFGPDILLLACGELRAAAQRDISKAKTLKWINAAKGG